MSAKAKNTKLFAVKRFVKTHPAAPVMMAFLPLRRSPRFVLAMIEKSKKQAGSRTLKKTLLVDKEKGVCPTCAKGQSDLLSDIK